MEQSEAGTQLKAAEADLVAVARQAAEERDPARMLQALWDSGLLAALTRKVESQYRELDRDEAHTVVGQAVDDFYAAVSAGQLVRNPKAWLFKVALRKAYQLHERKFADLPVDDWDVPADEDKDRDAFLRRREAMKVEALKIARALLPKLGQENVQKVMSYYFDAVEKEVEHVEISEVAEALSLSRDTVKQSISRGFRRLRRVALDSGITLDEAGFGTNQVFEDEEKDNG